jgi:hypothetical protein
VRSAHLSLCGLSSEELFAKVRLRDKIHHLLRSISIYKCIIKLPLFFFLTECKLACHKKCHPKIQIDCNEGLLRAGSTGGESGIFGTPLASLISDNIGIPTVVEDLVTAIELYGLRMEGLYRKSGRLLILSFWRGMCSAV